MRPTYWILTWQDPITDEVGSARYTQRAAVRGAAIIKRALGMIHVIVAPYWRNPE